MNSCYFDWRVQSVFGVVTNGDVLMGFPYDISRFLAFLRFPYEMSCLFALVPNMVVSK